MRFGLRHQVHQCRECGRQWVTRRRPEGAADFVYETCPRCVTAETQLTLDGALYVTLATTPIEHSAELHPNVVADYAADGTLVGLEVLDVWPQPTAAPQEPSAILTTTELAGGVVQFDSEPLPDPPAMGHGITIPTAGLWHLSSGPPRLVEPNAPPTAAPQEGANDR